MKIAKTTKTTNTQHKQKKERRQKMKQFAREATIISKSFQEVLEMTIQEVER